MQPATHLKQKSETWGLDDELCVNEKRIFFFFYSFVKKFSNILQLRFVHGICIVVKRKLLIYKFEIFIRRKMIAGRCKG